MRGLEEGGAGVRLTGGAGWSEQRGAESASFSVEGVLRYFTDLWRGSKIDREMGEKSGGFYWEGI